MKNITSWMIFGFIIFTSYRGTSQQYHPLVESNKVWSIAYFNAGPPFHMKYVKFEGDTLIGSYTYKQVLQSDDSVLYGWSGYYWYLRETNDHKVYYTNGLPIDSGYVIYDFNLNLHDSISMWWNSEIHVIADSVDSVQVENGQWRKRIFMESLNFGCTDTWIEGIGSLYGVMESLEGCLIGETSMLVCMLQNDIVVYHNPNYTNCAPYAAISSVTNDPLLMYPNPVESKLIIQSHFKDKASIELTDIYGRTVMKAKLITGENNFNISDLHHGVYLVKINSFNGDSQVVRKLIKE